MIKSQNIHLNDKRLYETFQMFWNQGSYGQALALLKTNPQLESKAMEAKIINTLQDYLYELQQKSDPSFKSEKIIVSKEPPVPEIGVGKIYFKSLEYREIIDEVEAYIKTIPEYAYKAKINKIGGKTMRWSQCVKNGNFVDDSMWVKSTYVKMTVSGNKATISTTTGSNRAYSISQESPIIKGHKYFVEATGKSHIVVGAANRRLAIQIGSNVAMYLPDNILDTEERTKKTIYTIPESETSNYIKVSIGTYSATAGEKLFDVSNIYAIDLTAIYGEGNEPTTTEDPRIAELERIAEARPQYDEGSIISADVSSVTSGETVITIPDSIRSLPGYGESNGVKVNTVDFLSGVYHKVGNYVGGEWVDDAQDIELPESFDTYFPVESGGEITFENEAKLAVPNSITFYTLG